MDTVGGTEWLRGGGELGVLVRSTDWSASSLGPRESWPQVLRTLVDLVLGSSFPAALLWGPEWLLVYNDAYRPVVAAEHPRALGRSARGSWSAQWHVDASVYAAVMDRGETVSSTGHAADGSFALCHSPVRVEGGTIAGVLVTLQRTTAQSAEARAAEQALRERKALLRAISDESKDVIFAKDRDGRLRYANPATLALIGKPLDDVLGKTDAELLDDADAARDVMENDRAVMESGVAVDLEEVVPRPDGTRRVWHSRKAPYRNADGQVVGVLGISRDITDRKRAEDEERRAKAKLQTTLASITEGLVVLDRDWRYTYFSETAAKMVGAVGETLVGQCIWDRFPKTRGTKFYDEFHRAVETDETVTFEEYYPAPIDKWFECRCYPTSEGLSVYFRDVSERKRADVALRESDERLRGAITSLTVERGKLEAIIRALPVGVVITETDSTTVSMNDAGLALHGFRSLAEMLAQLEAYNNTFELRHLDGRLLPTDQWPAARAMRGDFASNLEVRLRNVVTGFERIVSYSAVPILDYTGRTTLHVFLMLDVTARKLTESALERAAEEIAARARTIKSITDNASLGLVLIDARQRCTFMNPAAESVFGYTLAEIRAIDRPLHDIVHHTRPDGSHYPMEDCSIDRALPTRMQEHGEEVFVRHDGSFYPVAFNASPIVENGIAVGTILEVEDTTERKQREREVRESSERLELLARATAVFMETKLDVHALLERLVGELVPAHTQSAVVILLSKDRQHLEVAAAKHADPEALEELRVVFDTGVLPRNAGLSPDEIERGVAVRVEHVQPGELERTATPEVLAFLARHPVGSLLAVPLRTSRVLGALRLARPPEAAPFSASDQALFQDIADRAALALEAAMRFAEAEEAIHLRDDFLSIASHELRTPLTALQLQLQSMRHMLSKEERVFESDKLGRKLESANRQTERLVSLVEDLLDVSRLSLGKMQLHREELDLAEVAREIVERHAPQASAAGCPLRLKAESVRGEWDRLRLEQVLTNLIANAIKYGSGKPVEVVVSGAGPDARLVIRDRGIGIQPADVDRIFGRFERAVSGRHYGGLGLGLFISKQIVEAHGGSIRAESMPGRGAAFHVTLPTMLGADGKVPLMSEQGA